MNKIRRQFIPRSCNGLSCNLGDMIRRQKLHPNQLAFLEGNIVDYFQGVVYDYLRADRAIFINAECLIQIQPGDQPRKGTSWICDAIAADFKAETVFLCEVTYSKSLHALVQRLSVWNENWELICNALANEKYNNLPINWKVRPWLFVPGELIERLNTALHKIADDSGRLNFKPRITLLEEVLPWKYREWDRIRAEGVSEVTPAEAPEGEPVAVG